MQGSRMIKNLNISFSFYYLHSIERIVVAAEKQILASSRNTQGIDPSLDFLLTKNNRPVWSKVCTRTSTVIPLSLSTSLRNYVCTVLVVSAIIRFLSCPRRELLRQRCIVNPVEGTFRFPPSKSKPCTADFTVWLAQS